ncbi:MAG: hypothetical protein ACREFZ_00855 [Acetobacteraceae bacterium]
MSAFGLLARAKAAGMTLAADADGLLWEAERDPPDALLAELAAHKGELLTLLGGRAPIREQAADTAEALAERAAIIEHEAGIPRAWAEGFTRLGLNRPPADVPLPRWHRFVDGAGRFLDQWAERAAALGWNSLDLFGADRDRPLARVDKAGLLWLLGDFEGARVVALSAETAVVETGGGSRLTYRVRPREPGRVLAWDMAAAFEPAAGGPRNAA